MLHITFHCNLPRIGVQAFQKFESYHPGVLECSDWHAAVKEFLRSQGGIDGALFNTDGTARQIAKLTKKFIKDITKNDIGIFLFSHCDTGGKDKTYVNYLDWVANRAWRFYEEKLDDSKFKTQVTGEVITGKELFLRSVFINWHHYISVSTSIKNRFVDRVKEIEEMSTGELATVLLKLKLVTEGLNSQIILLDQPEDHLDNNFIATGLVELLISIKKERQVIIATHNANLVVGADTEQVIVAHGIEQDYTYGSLENEVIRKEIITILEGGADAFKKRSDKLRIH